MEINAEEFDKKARTIFKPAYPAVASQILAHTGITQGCCLDIGCGGGYLGIELVKQSQLTLRFLDQSQDMLDIVARNLAESGLEERGETILADAEQIPLPDQSVDLAVSRGSVFFWEDHVAAFSEIMRVLAPGGMSYIGGGFGSAAIRDSIRAMLEAQEESREKAGQKSDHPKFRDMMKRNLGPEMRRKFEDALGRAGIASYEMVHNQEEGLWIVMHKAN